MDIYLTITARVAEHDTVVQKLMRRSVILEISEARHEYPFVYVVFLSRLSR